MGLGGIGGIVSSEVCNPVMEVDCRTGTDYLGRTGPDWLAGDRTG